LDRAGSDPIVYTKLDVPARSGVVRAVRGAIVDVDFTPGFLPAINEAVLIQRDPGDTIVAEVQAHLDQISIRAIALRSTIGLRRGQKVVATGDPVKTPVGEAVLGRLIDVIDELSSNLRELTEHRRYRDWAVIKSRSDEKRAPNKRSEEAQLAGCLFLRLSFRRYCLNLGRRTNPRPPFFCR